MLNMTQPLREFHISCAIAAALAVIAFALTF